MTDWAVVSFAAKLPVRRFGDGSAGGQARENLLNGIGGGELLAGGVAVAGDPGFQRAVQNGRLGGSSARRQAPKGRHEDRW
ncbi:hypothetical protein GCM10022408_24010 [Hymenobacter fastidiosus]|uniref:Uncharacterized protein n=1 Tax=Hymenobacter fastidiosus TaxID=486264 RepID=A0ABP7SEV7_9BACT